MPKKIVVAILVCCVAWGAQAAGAQTARDETRGDFRWIVAPYAWLTGLSGTIGAKGYETSVDSSFADLSKYLTIGAMVHLEMVYRDRVGLFTDANYSLLSAQVSGEQVSLDGKTSLFVADVDAFYRLGTVPLGASRKATATFDLTGGARIWNLALKLNASTQQASRDIFRQKTWVDPIVGARIAIQMTDAWSLNLRGGVGGFSISSSLTWDASAVLGYTFWEHGTVLLGYRAVGVNYNTGSGSDAFKFDTTLSGPIVGLAFTF